MARSRVQMESPRRPTGSPHRGCRPHREHRGSRGLRLPARRPSRGHRGCRAPRPSARRPSRGHRGCRAPRLPARRPCRDIAVAARRAAAVGRRRHARKGLVAGGVAARGLDARLRLGTGRIAPREAAAPRRGVVNIEHAFVFAHHAALLAVMAQRGGLLARPAQEAPRLAGGGQRQQRQQQRRQQPAPLAEIRVQRPRQQRADRAAAGAIAVGLVHEVREARQVHALLDHVLGDEQLPGGEGAQEQHGVDRAAPRRELFFCRGHRQQRRRPGEHPGDEDGAAATQTDERAANGAHRRAVDRRCRHDVRQQQRGAIQRHRRHDPARAPAFPRAFLTRLRRLFCQHILPP